MLNRFTSSGHLVVLALLQASSLCAQPSPQFASAARVDKQFLSGLIVDPVIRSFDLSPDGKLIAVLVVAGLNVKAPLWLVTVDRSTKGIAASRELGPSASTSVGGLDFSEQVLYSSDQQYLVVQDLQEIRVLDARTLEPLRTIANPSRERGQVPLLVLGASNSDVFVCAFGAAQQPYGFHPTPAQVAVVDVSSGKVLGEWAAEDVPQAISPNGDLIAVSSWGATHRGVVPLHMFDRTGRKVAELADGFSFSEDADQPKPMGRVMAAFLSNQEIVLSPDAHFDKTGHHSGDSLRLLTIAYKQPQQSVTPRHYMSEGGLAGSADGRTVVATSRYVPPRILAQPHGVISMSSPELLILRRDGGLHFDSALPTPGLGSGFGGRLANRNPRVSSDGSVVAIAQDGGVTVLIRVPQS
jgi:hypothetical protein